MENYKKLDTAILNIILFDGVCNLCNASVQFILKRDKRAYFHFASLQSETGKKILSSVGLDPEAKASIVLIDKGTLYQRSSAALHIARHLNGGWPVLYIFMLVPAFIRNAVYNWIARNRYKWFGKRESCMLPQPEWKSRFIDE